MIEILLYILVIISTVLLSWNSFWMEGYIKDMLAKIIASDGSLLEKFLKGKVVIKIGLPLIFTLFSIGFIMTIYDLAVSPKFSDWLWLSTVSLLILMPILVKIIQIEILIKKNVNSPLYPFVKMLLSAWVLSIIPATILAVILYNTVIPALEKPEDNGIPLYYMLQNIWYAKDSFYHMLITLFEDDTQRTIFAFFTFVQSFFLFAYVGRITTIIGEYKKSEDKFKNITAPFVVACIMLLPLYLYQNDVAKEIKKMPDGINQEVDKNKELKATIEDEKSRTKKAESIAAQLRIDAQKEKAKAKQEAAAALAKAKQEADEKLKNIGFFEAFALWWDN